jgi:Zn-dependent protease
MLPETPDRAPNTPNEWGILVIVSFFFGLFLMVELAHEFSIEKLSVPFFLIAWVILLVIHEAGHALMAGLVGWRVERIAIGCGRVRTERRILGVPVEFRTLPLSGWVLPRPLDLRAPRLKQCLICAAGPGIELLLVALIVLFLGGDRLLAASADPAVIAAQSFCVAAVFGALFNLLPFPHRTEKGVSWSDGLGMILCWRTSDEAYRRWRDGEESAAEP